MSVRILIVDDEPAQMRALCDTLGAHGYETIGRSSSEAALQALRADSYHVMAGRPDVARYGWHRAGAGRARARPRPGVRDHDR
jgi:hypothetical protein